MNIKNPPPVKYTVALCPTQDLRIVLCWTKLVLNKRFFFFSEILKIQQLSWISYLLDSVELLSNTSPVKSGSWYWVQVKSQLFGQVRQLPEMYMVSQSMSTMLARWPRLVVMVIVMSPPWRVHYNQTQLWSLIGQGWCEATALPDLPFRVRPTVRVAVITHGGEGRRHGILVYGQF